MVEEIPGIEVENVIVLGREIEIVLVKGVEVAEDLEVRSSVIQMRIGYGTKVVNLGFIMTLRKMCSILRKSLTRNCESFLHRFGEVETLDIITLMMKRVNQNVVEVGAEGGKKNRRRKRNTIKVGPRVKMVLKA